MKLRRTDAGKETLVGQSSDSQADRLAANAIELTDAELEMVSGGLGNDDSTGTLSSLNNLPLDQILGALSSGFGGLGGI